MVSKACLLKLQSIIRHIFIFHQFLPSPPHKASPSWQIACYKDFVAVSHPCIPFKGTSFPVSRLRRTDRKCIPYKSYNRANSPTNWFVWYNLLSSMSSDRRHFRARSVSFLRLNDTKDPTCPGDLGAIRILWNALSLFIIRPSQQDIISLGSVCWGSSTTVIRHKIYIKMKVHSFYFF